MLNLKRTPILYSPFPLNEPLPGSVANQYQNTNPLPAADGTYVHRPVHMGTIYGYQVPLLIGYRNNGESNKVVGRMFAYHFLFLREHNITPSKRYLSEHMDN